MPSSGIIATSRSCSTAGHAGALRPYGRVQAWACWYGNFSRTQRQMGTVRGALQRMMRGKVFIAFHSALQSAWTTWRADCEALLPHRPMKPTTPRGDDPTTTPRGDDPTSRWAAGGVVAQDRHEACGRATHPPRAGTGSTLPPHDAQMCDDVRLPGERFACPHPGSSQRVDRAALQGTQGH